MSLKTGIDIVAVSRFETLLDKHGEALTQKFFSIIEREHAQKSDFPAQCYATYWALREAAYKIGGGSLWNDYSVDPAAGGFSLVVDEELFAREACNVPPETDWSCSVTCTGDEILATVFASFSTDLT